MKCDRNRFDLLFFVKMNLESQIFSIIQDEYDEIETAYTEEKRLLIELEERFEKLKEEYDKVIDRLVILVQGKSICLSVRLWRNARTKQDDWQWKKNYDNDVGEQPVIFNDFGKVIKFER